MVGFDKNDGFLLARRRMIENQLVSRGIRDERVLKAMEEIKREEFIPERYRNQAYEDGPVPIGSGQTISQPYIVALMSESLQVEPDDEILEIGTGCGYQTAVLAKLGRWVFSVERHSPLSESAQAILARVGIDNVSYHIGDGTKGWPDAEPGRFDRIIVTAAGKDIPEPLVEQLSDGGIFVAPVGGASMQELVVGRKINGKIQKQSICSVRFVKLIGDHGYDQ